MSFVAEECESLEEAAGVSSEEADHLYVSWF